MSKKSKSRNSAHPLAVANSVAVAPVLPRSSSLDLFHRINALRVVEDARQWHPERQNRHPKTVHGQRAPIRARDKRYRSPAALLKRLPSQTRAVLAFPHPGRVIECVRRKIRKEVIHALKLQGKGAGSKKRKRDWKSKIRC